MAVLTATQVLFFPWPLASRENVVNNLNHDLYCVGEDCTLDCLKLIFRRSDGDWIEKGLDKILPSQHSGGCEDEIHLTYQVGRR